MTEARKQALVKNSQGLHVFKKKKKEKNLKTMTRERERERDSKSEWRGNVFWKGQHGA